MTAIPTSATDNIADSLLPSQVERVRRDPNAVGAVAFRKRRSHMIMRLIEEASRGRGHCRIADLGGEWWYWKIIDREFLIHHQVSIHLINPGPVKHHEIDDELFTVVPSDACDLRQLPDRSFDLVHSNSVIEHVGDWSRMVAFATEARRLSSRYYVQTPNFWFPLEPHFGMAPFIHWFPEPVRVHLMTQFRFGPIPVKNVTEAMAKSQSARLLSMTAFRTLFPDAIIQREKVAGLTKSLIAVRHGE
jgi:hypothetical protein